MLDTEALVDEELVRVVCPVTLRVPLEVRDVVAVIDPPVIDPAESEVIKDLLRIYSILIVKQLKVLNKDAFITERN